MSFSADVCVCVCVGFCTFKICVIIGILFRMDDDYGETSQTEVKFLKLDEIRNIFLGFPIPYVVVLW